MPSGIYIITNKTNGNFYVGSAVDLKKRWRRHKYDLKTNKHDNNYLQNAWNMYGEDCFEFSVLEYVEDKASLISIEQRYIDELHPAYNLAPKAGSLLGLFRTEEHRKKLSLAGMGHKGWNKGKSHSEEHRMKISKALTGKKQSEETKKKLSIAFKGKPLSEETKRKMSLSRMGNIPGNKGKKHTEEAREKIIRALTGRPVSEETRKKLSQKFKGRIISEETRQKISATKLAKKAITKREDVESNLSTE